MTLTEAKARFGLSDLDIRCIINTQLRKGIDYNMQIWGDRRVFTFTSIGEYKLVSILGKTHKEILPC